MFNRARHGLLTEPFKRDRANGFMVVRPGIETIGATAANFGQLDTRELAGNPAACRLER